MADRFSLSEVLRIAEEIERNGQKFYSQAADKTKDAAVKQLMRELAEKEKEHEEVFAQMRGRYCGVSDAHEVDSTGEVAAYIRSLAETHVFNLNKDIAKLLLSLQTPGSILQLAIGFEKDTIAYFSALKNAVSSENKEKVELLIQEEVGHIRLLQETRKNLG